MSVLSYITLPAAVIFTLAQILFVRYAVGNMRVMKGHKGHLYMAIGAIAFVSGGIVGIFRELEWFTFLIRLAGVLLIVAGVVLRMRVVQRTYRISISKIFSLLPHSKFYFIGITTLVFLSLPLYLYIVLWPPGEIVWTTDPGAVLMITWAFGSINLAIGERRFYLSTQPSAAAAAAGGKEKILLLKDDILAVRGYGALTNMFLATAKPTLGDKPLRDVLTEHFEYNPLLFEGCKIKDDGTINMEPIMKNLDRISGENGVHLLCSAFSTLNSKLMSLYGAVTSPDMAEKALGVSYSTVKKQYGDLPVFFDILRSLPEGVLEEEKLALLSREELEARVKERTAELEKAYEQLKTLDKMKSDFISMTAHELHTPLTPITSYVELMRDGKMGKFTSKEKKRVERAAERIKEFSSLIDDMLDISRIEARKLGLMKEQVSIGEVVDIALDEVLSLFGEQKHRVTIDIPDGLPLVYVDKKLIVKVFSNLLSNAMKYMPAKGKVTVTAKRDEKNMHITVVDTGIGIPEKEQTKIFEKFYVADTTQTSRRRGIGLGLAITRGIVEAHNGKIWVESKVGEGSTFHVLLPKMGEKT